MRRILVDHAREKVSAKRGGTLKRVDIDAADVATKATPDQLLAIDDALAKLAREDPSAAKLVELRYFAGLTVDEAGKALGMSTAAAYKHWNYAAPGSMASFSEPWNREAKQGAASPFRPPKVGPIEGRLGQVPVGIAVVSSHLRVWLLRTATAFPVSARRRPRADRRVEWPARTRLPRGSGRVLRRNWRS